MSQFETSSTNSNDEECWKLPEPDFAWDTTSELALYQSLIVHKPAGINKHFSVALVSERLTEKLGKPVLAGSIWKKLRTMFDLGAVDDREESIPFPIEVKEFSLPRREFESLILDRQKEWRDKCQVKFQHSTRTPDTPKSEGSAQSRRGSPVAKDKYEFDDDMDDDDDDDDVDLDNNDGGEGHDDSDLDFSRDDDRELDLDSSSVKDQEDFDDSDRLKEDVTEQPKSGQQEDEVKLDLLPVDETKNDDDDEEDEAAVSSAERELEKERTREKAKEITTKLAEVAKGRERERAKEREKERSKDLVAGAAAAANKPVKLDGKESASAKKPGKDDEPKSATKRHITRSTPNNTPNKRRK